jgi:hypothetical protein
MALSPSPRSKKVVLTKRRLLWTLAAIAGVLVASYLVWAMLAYSLQWRGPKTQAASRIAPIPAASVGWNPLSLYSYLFHQQTIEHYTNYLSINSPGVFADGQKPDSRQVAMTKIVRDWATQRIADDQNIGVTPTDLDQAFNAQLLQGGDRAQTTKAIKDLYGWTPELFKKYVLRTAVIREKLREKLSFDDAINADERKQAERVYAIVKEKPADFTELAKQYSEDVYGSSGGDLGFFARGEHAKEIDDAAFALNVGEISDLVHTKFGWHILTVEEKRETNGQEEVHARQIFIAAPGVDDYITAHLNDWGVRMWLSEFSWDTKTGQAVVRK